MRIGPLAATLLVLAATAPAVRGLEPGVAARVNGVAISTERLDRYFEDFLADSGRHVAAIRSPAAYDGLRRQALERLVEIELLWQEAQRRRVLAARPEVDAAVAELRAGFKRPGAFEARLSRGGFTEASYAEWLRVQLSIRRLVQEEIVAHLSVTAAEEETAREEARAIRPDLPEAEARRAAREQALARKAQEALAGRIRELRQAASIEVARAR